MLILVGILPCVYVMCVRVHGDQKKVLDPLELGQL